jgi:putative toxin-antitoxin system antitoxin component (TIGR02293 family)
MPGSVITAVFEKLGGRAALGTVVASDADLARVVLARIPLKALKHVQRHGLSLVEIGTFIIPARTQRHRRERREPLSVEESDRLVRMTRIQALAEDVFGDLEKGSRWLREPLGELSGKRPLEVAQTEAGARLVEQVLAKIDWGAAA